MQIDLTYRQIWKISVPIMLGSAAQNVITMSDAVLLYHKGEAEFAAIGLVGVFYIAIVAIGYGFSRGGQIIIARRMGENNTPAVGKTFYAMLWFEMMLAIALFLFMWLAGELFFSFFVEKQSDIFRLSMEYLHYRSWGVFFSYLGVAMVALYTGIARTGVILFSTAVLALVNLALNFALIFGKWGFPEMGIGGAGLASSIAEVVTFGVFLTYVLFDKKLKLIGVLQLQYPDFQLIKQQVHLAFPMVAHSVLGQVSWLFFFGMVENLGARALAISNLTRTVYLLLSIPLWGYSAGVNTVVSNLLGQKRHRDVLTAAWKTGLLCWATTMLVAVPILFFPEILLYPLLGKSDMSLIQEAKPLFHYLLFLLTLATFGSVVVNTLAGTGATTVGLKLQVIGLVIYLTYLWLSVYVFRMNLMGIWFGEVVYWVTTVSLTLWYLLSWKWLRVRV